MTNLDVFEAVAARKISPQEGADAMLTIDRAARAAARPQHMPKWLWRSGSLVLALLVLPLLGRAKRRLSRPTRRAMMIAAAAAPVAEPRRTFRPIDEAG